MLRSAPFVRLWLRRTFKIFSVFLSHWRLRGWSLSLWCECLSPSVFWAFPPDSGKPVWVAPLIAGYFHAEAPAVSVLFCFFSLSLSVCLPPPPISLSTSVCSLSHAIGIRFSVSTNRTTERECVHSQFSALSKSLWDDHTQRDIVVAEQKRTKLELTKIKTNSEVKWARLSVWNFSCSFQSKLIF